jgi:regulatory protein
MARQRFSSAGERPPGAADELFDPPTEEVARTIVLNSLTHSQKTRRQLADLLAERGVTVDISIRVLDRFEEVRLIDDKQYAEVWVRSRHANRGLARRVLRQELLQKGVDEDYVEEAVAQIDDEDELTRAYQFAKQKLRSMGRLDDAAKRRRLFGALVRRGYESSTASRAINDVISEKPADFNPAPGSAVP